MRSYQKFLFYYSLIVLTILLVASLFFLPQPQSFFALALFVPIPLYFWFKFTLVGEDSPYRWSLKMFSLLLATGVLGIFAFWLVGQTPNQSSKTTLGESSPLPIQTVTSDNENEEVIKALEEIKTDISQIKAEERATRELLGISSSAREVSDILSTILKQATGSASP